MVLSLIRDDTTDLTTLTGLTTGGASVELGQNNLVSQAGPHFIGVDSTLDSLVKFTAAYDPALETDDEIKRLLDTCDFIGHVQFEQLRFLGQPLPPSLFTGPLARFGPYASADTSVHPYEFVDFMGPAQVLAYLRGQVKTEPAAVEPFFAANSVLSEQIREAAELFVWPRKNGALMKHRPDGASDARAAVIRGWVTFAQINEDQIDAMVKILDPLARMPVTAGQAAATPHAALGLTAVAALPGIPDDEQLTREDITGARQIGRYTLLSVDDFDDEEPALCIWVENDHVVVTLLPWEDLHQWERDNVEGLLARIGRFFKRNGVVLPNVRIAAEKRGRGTGGGFTRIAFPELSGPCLEVRMRTGLFGRLAHAQRKWPFGIVPLAGIEWGLIWDFDRTTRNFSLSTVTAPNLIAAPASLAVSGALQTYFQAVNLPENSGAGIDLSNFAQADLDTEDFGGDRKKRKIIKSDG